jgi:hypothetical protein
MNKILLFLTINLLQAEEMVLKPIDIFKEKNNPLLTTSIDNVIKSHHPSVDYWQKSLQYFLWIFLEPLLEMLIFAPISKLIFDKPLFIENIDNIREKTEISFFNTKCNPRQFKIILTTVIIMIIMMFMRLSIYIYNIHKNKLFNLINTTIIFLFLIHSICWILTFFIDPNKSTILVLFIFIPFLINIVISIIGIIVKIIIDNKYKNKIKLYEEEIRAEYNKNVEEYNKDNKALDNNLDQWNTKNNILNNNY